MSTFVRMDERVLMAGDCHLGFHGRAYGASDCGGNGAVHGGRLQLAGGGTRADEECSECHDENIHRSHHRRISVLGGRLWLDVLGTLSVEC